MQPIQKFLGDILRFVMARAAWWGFAVVLCSGSEPVYRFIDTAATSGLTSFNTFGGKETKASILESTGTGVAILDFDGDGANDVFFPNGTVLNPGFDAPRSQLYKNDGTGHFAEVGQKAGLMRSGWAQAACAGDFNNDGHPDLLVTYYGHNTLYRNSGNGKFTDVTEASGLPITGKRWGSGCAFLDYDRDGYLDIFIANYVDLADPAQPGPKCDWKGLQVACGPRGLPHAHNILYHNNRDGTFTDVSEAAGILKPGGRYGLGVAVADFDNDGWPDIYVACDQSPSLLYRNRHDGTFAENAEASGVAYNADGQLQAGMGIAIADYDSNGFFDIAKTNFSGDRPSLYRGEDGKFFEDVSETAGLGHNQLLGWGMAFLDIDEDGWPDLIMANGHVYPQIDRSAIGETYRQKTLLYRNTGTGKFADITGFAGPAFQTTRPSRGLAIGDLDGTGRPSIVIANMNSTPTLLKNAGPRANAIALTLTGTRSNRSAIGARCIIESAGHKQMAEVASGGSFYSQNSFTVYFGLGRAAQLDRLEIRWPNSETQIWQNVSANRTLLITEGSKELKPVAWKTDNAQR